jgi:hypothetical protein
MDYFEHMQRRLDGQEQFFPSHLLRKSEVRRLAAMIGVQTPRIYGYGPLQEVLAAELPDEFVLKPAFASTSIGVVLLRADGDGYENLLDGSHISREDLVERCMIVARRYFDDPDSADFIAEELLRDHEGQTPPRDVRFYTFQGEIGMVLMEEHLAGPAAAMYFDGDFLPFADLDKRYGVAPGAESLESIVPAKTPENWRDLLAVARRVSIAVPTAFCRVDLYDTAKGVYLGEITFYPGTFYYRNRKLMFGAEAERLGRLWDNATERLRGSVASSAPKNPDLGVPAR